MLFCNNGQSVPHVDSLVMTKVVFVKLHRAAT